MTNQIYFQNNEPGVFYKHVTRARRHSEGELEKKIDFFPNASNYSKNINNLSYMSSAVDHNSSGGVDEELSENDLFRYKTKNIGHVYVV